MIARDGLEIGPQSKPAETSSARSCMPRGGPTNAMRSAQSICVRLLVLSDSRGCVFEGSTHMAFCVGQARKTPDEPTRKTPDPNPIAANARKGLKNSRMCCNSRLFGRPFGAGFCGSIKKRQRPETELESHSFARSPVGMASATLRVVRPSKAEDAERPRLHSHGDRGSESREAPWPCVGSLKKGAAPWSLWRQHFLAAT
jgi:hypothetical protein